MAVKIITDSASDLTPELAQRLAVTIIPIRVNFGSETYYDGIDLNISGFLSHLQEAKEPPTTSQPAPQSYLDAAKPLLAQGHDVLILTVSSGVSGTYQSAELAARQLPGGRVRVVDSLLVSAGLGLLVRECAEAALQGASLQEVASLAQERRASISMVAMLDTVDYIVAGGRLSIYKSHAAKKPGMRLIFTANDLGQAEILERAPGRRRALERLYSCLEDTPRDWSQARVVIAHSNCRSDAGMIGDWIEARLGSRVDIWSTGSTVAAYVGPGAILAAF